MMANVSGIMSVKKCINGRYDNAHPKKILDFSFESSLYVHEHFSGDTIRFLDNIKCSFSIYLIYLFTFIL